MVSISAILVSLGTLFMIMYQTNLMRQEQRASVMPSLTIGTGYHFENESMEETIRVTNRGLGPAFIREVRIIDSNQAYETDVYGYLKKQGLHSSIEVRTINRLQPGSIIPPNERMIIYGKITDSTSTLTLTEAFEFYDDSEDSENIETNKPIMEIIYENVYGDRWRIRSDHYIPEEVE